MGKDFFDVQRNYNVHIRGRSPYFVRCRYQDVRGNVHIFRSRSAFIEPQLLQDTKIKVYVDGENYKNYYVDIDEVIPTVYEH